MSDEQIPDLIHHPRPQCRRGDWLDCSGPWSFADDPGDEGEESGWVDADLPDRITVPFARETAASGLERRGRMLAVWYRRVLEIPAEWAGDRVILHCQAVDHEATVWAGGVVVARHVGGYDPFEADLTDQVVDGRVTVVIRARDDWRCPQPRGKQSQAVHSAGCHYQRTTGIWQPVWLERRPSCWIGRPFWRSAGDGSALLATLAVHGPVAGCTLHLEAHYEGRIVAQHEQAVTGSGALELVLPLQEADRHPWSPADPALYDITLSLQDAAGQAVDRVASYAGLRSLSVNGNRLLLNGEPLFQRLVLDQGYWPESGLTPPDEAALVADIERARACGFDGARIHQRVPDERFYYHADRMGFLCWGEFPDWGLCDLHGPSPEPRVVFPPDFEAQWLAVVERDRSHPCIITWVPLNERDDGGLRADSTALQQRLDRITRLADPTRPIIHSSGWTHGVANAELWDVHDYEQDPSAMAAHHAGLADGRGFINGRDLQIEPYAGQPYVVSEFGGASLAADVGGSSWGYGNAVADGEELLARFAGLCRVLVANPGIAGYCYTQLTDVEQEVNGLFTFDRQPKVDPERLAAAQSLVLRKDVR